MHPQVDLPSPKRVLSRCDLTRDLSATFSKRAKALEEALNWLINRECIRRHLEPERPKGSRGGVGPPSISSILTCFPAEFPESRDKPRTATSREIGRYRRFAMEVAASIREEDDDEIPF